MQKSHLLILCLLSLSVWLQAQITVTNATFPVAGDTLKGATDFNPEGIAVTAPGGPFTWNYGNLNPDSRQAVVFRPAAEGMSNASFPGAELVVIGDAGEETYFDVSASAFSFLGISGSDLTGGLPFATELVYMPPLPERHAPLTFPSVFNSQTQIGFAISTAAIPGEILDSLGIPTGFLDSIRLRIDIQRDDFVDGYGTLTIPGGTYDVLRQKRTDYMDTRIDIHVPLLGWQDITDLIGVGEFGRDTVNSYYFISNTAKEPIAILVMDSTGLVVEEVEYKDNGVTSAVDHILSYGQEALVMPNPASNEATIELKNFLPGQYTLCVFDALGNRLILKQLHSTRELISLEDLSFGIYPYQILDRQNRIVAAGKLMKVD